MGGQHGRAQLSWKELYRSCGWSEGGKHSSAVGQGMGGASSIGEERSVMIHGCVS